MSVKYVPVKLLPYNIPQVIIATTNIAIARYIIIKAMVKLCTIVLAKPQLLMALGRGIKYLNPDMVRRMW